MSVLRPGRNVWRVETAVRAAILSARDRLLGEHCGVPADAVAASCPAWWNGSPNRPRRCARAA